jgi:hypothetical protein
VSTLELSSRGFEICFDTLNSRHTFHNRDPKLHRVISIWNVMNHDSIYVRTGRMSMLTISRIRLATVVAIALAIPMHLAGQNAQVTGLKLGGILGTVVDVNFNSHACYRQQLCKA